MILSFLVVVVTLSQALRQYAPWIVAAVAVAALVGVVIYYRVIRIHTYGRIIAVGISVNATYIDWGDIPPGGTSEVTVQLWNNGTVPVTVNVTTANWSPSQAEWYMNLTSSLSPTRVLMVNEYLDVKLTLKVFPDVQGFREFSFDVVLTATEVKIPVSEPGVRLVVR